MMGHDEKEITGKDVEIVEGQFININRGTVRNVEGGHIEMKQVCALSIDGEKIESTQAAVMMVSGNELHISQSAGILLSADNTKTDLSCIPVSISKTSSSINNSLAGVVASATVKAENSTALLVIANKIEGNLTTLLDWKTAIGLGAIAGGIFGFLSLLRKK